MSYKALVCKLRMEPHPNADRLRVGVVPTGEQVIVSLDTSEHVLGIYFPPDGQLSEDYAKANDLIARFDEFGKRINAGYFDDKRRVRSQKFRGVRSDGFWMTLDSLSYINKPHGLNEGDLVDSLVIDGVVYPLCEKYYTEATRKAQSAHAGSNGKKITLKTFPKHVDTENIQYYVEQLQAGDILHITRKLHGTSQRYAQVLVGREVQKKGFWNRLFRRKETVFGYELVHGTRKVTFLNENGVWTDPNTGRVIDPYRVEATKDFAPNPGEILYFEVVGFESKDKPIMSNHPLGSLPELKKRYGGEMRYTYGCNPGECAVYLYRVAQTLPNGKIVDMPWNYVRLRAAELGIPTVPFVETIVYDGDKEALLKKLSILVNGESGQEDIPDSLDARHIQEGVVIRRETIFTNYYKRKSFVFSVLEGDAKTKDVVDTEEAS